MKSLRTSRGALVALFLFLSLPLAGCGSPFFHPLREVPVPAGLDRFPWTAFTFPSTDNVTLSAWRIDPPPSVPCRGTILFLHGNGGNLGYQVGGVTWLAEAGYRIVALDYRGYGRSGGEPSPEGVVRDGEAALALLPTLPGVERERIAVFGQSLGGSVAIPVVARMKGRVPVKALVVEGAFAGYRRIVRDRISEHVLMWPLLLPARFLTDDDWSPERFVAAVSPVPFLDIHGTADPVVPFSHGERLHDLASEPKAFLAVEGGGHLDEVVDGAARRPILAFLEAAMEGRTAADGKAAADGKGSK
jgi:fermentation-respiration switch protein FrsA (DUF1100 family)